MKKYFPRAGLVGILMAMLVLLLTYTDPNALPIQLLILPFALIFLIIFLSVLFVLQRSTGNSRLFSQKSVAIAGIIAGLPVLLLVFQSIDQLSVRDILIILGFLGSGLFYLSKTDILRP